MRSRTKTALVSVGVAILMVVGTDAMTFAGTGESLILGHVNKSTKTTHVTSTGKGPALALHAKGNRPALAVDSKAKVVRLNADTVDGKHASGLQNNVRVYTAIQGRSTNGQMSFKLPNVPKGKYQATYSVYMYGAEGTPTSPASGSCYFHRSGTNSFPGATTSSSVGHDYPGLGLSGSDIIRKAGAAWTLECSAYQDSDPNDWSIHSGLPVRVTLTRIDKTIGGKLTTGRTAPDSSRLGH